MKFNKLALAITALFGSHGAIAQAGCNYLTTGPAALDINSGTCVLNDQGIYSSRFLITGLDKLKNIDIELDEYGAFLSTVYAYDYTSSINPFQASSFDKTQIYSSLVLKQPVETMINVGAGTTLTSSGDYNVFIGNSSSDAQYNSPETLSTVGVGIVINVNGSLDFKKNLIVESIENPSSAIDQTNNIIVSSGNVMVGGDFYALMVGHENGAPPLKKANLTLDNNSTLNIQGSAYIRTETGSAGLINENSNIKIGKDLVLLNTRLSNSMPNNDKNDYDSIALHNIDGSISASTIKILTEGFSGFSQQGNSSTISANSIIIDTTAQQTNSSYPVDALTSAMTLQGGKGYFGSAFLQSNAAAIQVTGSTFTFSLGSSDLLNAESITLQPNKAIIYIGNGASIESIKNHAININDNIDSIIQIENVKKLQAAAGMNLINDGSGNSIINLQKNSSLIGRISLGGGDDTINMRGIFSGIVDLGADSDTANLFGNGFSNLELIDAGTGQKDILNLFGTIDAASTYNTVRSGTVLQNFNEINIKPDSYFNLNGSSLISDQVNINKGGILALDPLIKDSKIDGNVINSGLINLDVSGSNIGQNLSISGNYHGDNGTIEIDTRWESASDPNNISQTDTLTITGNVTGRTRVSVLNGIAGDVTASDNPIIPVPEIIITGSVAKDAFWGSAPTKNAGEAQLLIDSQNKKFFWTLKTTGGEEIYSPDIPGYALAGHINTELIRDSVSTYRDRIGGEYNKSHDYSESKDGKSWARTWHKNLKSNGDIRLDWKSNSSGYQFGYQLNNSITKDGIVKTDGYISYARASSKAYDDFASESGSVINNKYMGNMHTHNINLGFTKTYINNDASYSDIVLQFSKLKNKYVGLKGGRSANNALAMTLSLEQGKQFNLTDRWFVEPMYQLMVNYISMEKFNDGIRNVSQGNYWDGLLRLGGRFYFRDPINEKQNNLLYIKSHYVRDFKTNSSAEVGRSKVIEGNTKQWIDFGFGFEVNASRNTYFFMDASFQRNLGGSYKASHAIQFGINHKW